MFSVVGAYAFYLGVSIAQDYLKGKIIEKCMKCTGSEIGEIKGYVAKQVSGAQVVNFIDAKGESYKFTVGSKYNFVPNTTYIIYYKKNQLLSWVSI